MCQPRSANMGIITAPGPPPSPQMSPGVRRSLSNSNMNCRTLCTASRCDKVEVAAAWSHLDAVQSVRQFKLEYELSDALHCIQMRPGRGHLDLVPVGYGQYVFIPSFDRPKVTKSTARPCRECGRILEGAPQRSG